MTESITVCGREITPKQLTMSDVHEFLQRMEQDAADKKPPHVVDIVFNDQVPAVAVSMSTGLSLDELAGKIPQDTMRALLDKVKAVNPFFVGMMERIVAVQAADQ